ncbi:MAG: hypothetical protein ACPG32_12550 [Akkermansiaceae bacterium]
MEKPNTSRDFQYLATAVAVIAAYYSFQASVTLARFTEMFSIMGTAAPENTPAFWMAQNTITVTAGIAMLFIFTLIAIWWKMRGHTLIASVCIVLLALSTHTIYQAAALPMFQMLEEVDNHGSSFNANLTANHKLLLLA